MSIGIFCDCHNTLMNSNEAWIKAFVDYIGEDKKEEIETCLYGKIKRRNLAKKYNIDFSLVENTASKYLKKNDLLIDILINLKEQGFHLFVISNAPRKRVVGDLKTTRLLNIFEEVYTEEDGGKKNNGIFDKVIDSYGLSMGMFIGNEEFDDHIDHPKVISMVLTSFLRDRFSKVKGYEFDDEGVIHLN